MKVLLFLVAIILITSPCFAGSSICKIEDSAIGIKAIGWNDDTATAKFTDFSGDTFSGVVTLRREHDSGEKVNLYFEFAEPRYGIDAKEYIVFPIRKDSFRVIGVSYSTIKGKRYLHSSEGNYKASCISM